jgi:hypothetical protein
MMDDEGDNKGKVEELDKGYCYLIKEEKPLLSYELFRFLSERSESLCVTRMYPDKLGKTAEKSQVVWLSNSPGKDRCPPTAISSLTKVIFEVLEKEGSVLFDGIEYMVIHNGFEQTLIFVEHLNEFTMQKQGVVIIPINPAAYNQRELALLERNIRVLEGVSDITEKDISSLIEEY